MKFIYRISVLLVLFSAMFSAPAWSIETVQVLTSSDFRAKVVKENRIYEIKCDVDLKGTEFQIPANCVLKFTGGSISNGTLCGNGTRLENASNLPIFNNITVPDKPYQFINDWIYVDWFGGKDDSERLQKAFDFASRNKNPISFLSREYVMTRTVVVNTGHFMLRGCGDGGEYGQMGSRITASDNFVSSYTGKPLFYILGNGKPAENKLGDVSGRVTGLTVYTNRKNDVFQFKLAASPSRPFFIDHCTFYKCATVVRILDNGGSTAMGFLYVENCTMKGNLWNIVARGRHTLLGLYFCKNVAEQCDGNINLGFSETFTKTPFDKYAPKPLDYSASANIVISDNLLEGTVDCIYINGGKCIVNIERNYFETSRRQFVVLAFSNPNSVITFRDNYISAPDDLDLSLKNCYYTVQPLDKAYFHLVNSKLR